jgi:hypothetical protein
MRRSLVALGVTVAALLCAAAGGARTAAAPTVTTGPVTQIGATSATVSGTVNPGGQATTWHVEYGTSTSYGSSTASTSAGSGTATTSVSGSLTSLSPGTTYHYRVVAVNGAGTARGADGIFTTFTPPGVVTGAATNVTPTSATLNGTVDPNGRPTSWFFEYGTSTSYGTKTAVKSAGSGGSAVAAAASISGLARGRLYHYRLVATSDGGTTQGADQTFTTAGAPTATTDPASSVGSTAARLNGRVNPNGQATRWWFEYGTTTGYGSRTSTRNAGSGTSAARVAVSVSGLRRETTYHFRLVATNDSGTSVGADRTFSTALTPSVRTGPSSNVGTTTATVAGTVDPRGRATSWWFEYGTTTGYGSRTSARNAGAGNVVVPVSASLSRLTPGAAYHYRLVARNGAGTSRGADQTFTTVGVTLTTAARTVVYGRGLTLTGTVPTRRAGETVTVLAQAFGEGSFRSVVSVITGTDGVWRYVVKPRIRTSYAALWEGGRSPASTVGVRPAVSLRRTAAGLYSTRVVGVRSFAGRVVQLQRRSATGRWITVKRVRLNQRSAALFRATLPRGTSRLRIAMSINQAGAGYLAGFSRTIVYRRA